MPKKACAARSPPTPLTPRFFVRTRITPPMMRRRYVCNCSCYCCRAYPHTDCSARLLRVVLCYPAGADTVGRMGALFGGGGGGDRTHAQQARRGADPSPKTRRLACIFSVSSAWSRDSLHDPSCWPPHLARRVLLAPVFSGADFLRRPSCLRCALPCAHSRGHILQRPRCLSWAGRARIRLPGSVEGGWGERRVPLVTTSARSGSFFVVVGKGALAVTRHACPGAVRSSRNI